jgi:hypothetical protein
MRHAATDDDALDVVGHDQQVHGPRESTAHVVDEVASVGVAAAAAW